MFIFHGDNTINSRQALTDLLESLKEKGLRIERLAAKSLTPQELENALGGQSLFGTEHVVVIEDLHSLPESAKKKELIAQLQVTDTEVVLWEKRLLTKTMLNKFAKAKEQSYVVSNILFKWLDQLGTATNKKQLIEQMHAIFKKDSAQFCFTMLIRQVRLLISALDDGKISGAPFIVAKLKKQARSFSLDQLLQLHRKLLEIDYRQKRSASRLTLEQELDLLLLSL